MIYVILFSRCILLYIRHLNTIFQISIFFYAYLATYIQLAILLHNKSPQSVMTVDSETESKDFYAQALVCV